MQVRVMPLKHDYHIGHQCNGWTVVSGASVMRGHKRFFHCQCKCGRKAYVLAYRLNPKAKGAATCCPACATTLAKDAYTATLTREYLIDAYVSKRRTINDIATEMGFDPLTVKRRLRSHGIPIRQQSDAEVRHLSGRTFGLLTVGKSLRKHRGGSSVLYYQCTCACGVVREVRAAHLLAGASKACKRCASRPSSASPHWKGCGDITGYYWGRACRGAVERGLPVEITIEQAWQIFVRQDRRCALTGLPLTMLGGNSAEAEATASLDRIDSSRGYVAGNVQWVHKHINRMKNDFDEAHFKGLCRLIVQHARLCRRKKG
jgi:hypothetical protein